MSFLFKFLFIFILCFETSLLFAEDNSALFSGRISRINKDSSLIRLRVDFNNMKFLRIKDRVEFWNETYPTNRCVSYVEGRSNRYLLLKIPSFKECILKVGFTTGTYLHLYSSDLLHSLETVNELVDVLIKKRLALSSRKNRFQNEMDSYVDKIDLVNKRYELLRQKLELEWQGELSSLEEDKLKTGKLYSETQAKLNEVEFKLQQYRIEDENLKLDRWSLDPSLYLKK